MILGWTTPTSKGEHLVKEFKLNGGQRCKFICVVNDLRTFYKVFVEHGGKSDYIQLSKLPLNIKYMVFYLQRSIKIQYDKNNSLEFISMQNVDTQKFKQEMQNFDRENMNSLITENET